MKFSLGTYLLALLIFHSFCFGSGLDQLLKEVKGNNIVFSLQSSFDEDRTRAALNDSYPEVFQSELDLQEAGLVPHSSSLRLHVVVLPDSKPRFYLEGKLLYTGSSLSLNQDSKLWFPIAVIVVLFVGAIAYLSKPEGKSDPVYFAQKLMQLKTLLHDGQSQPLDLQVHRGLIQELSSLLKKRGAQELWGQIQFVNKDWDEQGKELSELFAHLLKAGSLLARDRQDYVNRMNAWGEYLEYFVKFDGVILNEAPLQFPVHEDSKKILDLFREIESLLNSWHSICSDNAIKNSDQKGELSISHRRLEYSSKSVMEDSKISEMIQSLDYEGLLAIKGRSTGFPSLVSKVLRINQQLDSLGFQEKFTIGLEQRGDLVVSTVEWKKADLTQSGKQPTLLIVDDELESKYLDHTMVREVLNLWRWQAAGSYAEAKEILSREKFDLVFLDRHFPIDSSDSKTVAISQIANLLSLTGPKAGYLVSTTRDEVARLFEPEHVLTMPEAMKLLQKEASSEQAGS